MLLLQETAHLSRYFLRTIIWCIVFLTRKSFLFNVVVSKRNDGLKNKPFFEICSEPFLSGDNIVIISLSLIGDCIVSIGVTFLSNENKKMPCFSISVMSHLRTIFRIFYLTNKFSVRMKDTCDQRNDFVEKIYAAIKHKSSLSKI